MTSSSAFLRGTPPHLAHRELVYATPERLDDFFRAIVRGFHDDYVPEKEGQSIDVTGMPPGRYVLVHRANPDRVLRERSYANNEASVLLRLQAGRVTVLRRCPASAACGT